MGIYQEYIERLTAVRDNGTYEEQGKLVQETVSAFEGSIDAIKKGLDRYKGRMAVFGPGISTPPVKYDNRGDIEKLIGKLRVELEKQECRQPSEFHGIYVTQNANPVVSQEASSYSASNAQAAFSQAYENINRLETLDEGEKLLLIGMLKDIEDSEGDEREGKIMRCVKHVAEKAFDVFKAIAPALTQAALS